MCCHVASCAFPFFAKSQIGHLPKAQCQWILEKRQTKGNGRTEDKRLDASEPRVR